MKLSVASYGIKNTYNLEIIGIVIRRITARTPYHCKHISAKVHKEEDANKHVASDCL